VQLVRSAHQCGRRAFTLEGNEVADLPVPPRQLRRAGFEQAVGARFDDPRDFATELGFDGGQAGPAALVRARVMQ